MKIKRLIPQLGASLVIALLLLPQSQVMASFFDVSDIHPNTEAINSLQEDGVVEGYPNGYFAPENRINRAEMVKIVTESVLDDETIESCIGQNTNEQDTTAFYSDVPKDTWYAKYVCAATEANLVSGHDDGTFKPSDYVNFAEISKISALALKLEVDGNKQGKWYDPFVLALESQKAIPGSIHNFDEDVTRGEMSEIIWRLDNKVTSKVSITYDEIDSNFPQVASCRALSEKFYEHAYSYYYDGYAEADAVFDVAEESSAAEPASTQGATNAVDGESAKEYSETNVQVEGVDEADIIKNDGQYIYLIKGNTVRIVRAYPADQMEELAVIELSEDNDFQPKQLLLNDDQLIIIGTEYEGFSIHTSEPMPVDYAPNYYTNKTRVYTLDVSDHTDPEVSRDVIVDGSYNTARRINDSLYLVLNQYPDYYFAEYDDEIGESLLPEIQDGDSQPEPVVDCTDVRYLPGHGQPYFVVLLGIDLSDSQSDIDRNVILGSSENVYASLSNLYIAQTNYNYSLYSDWDWAQESTTTDIFKFNINDAEIEYDSHVIAQGSILNQFSMDEHDGYFRIATSSGNRWSDVNPLSNNVIVFNDQMQQVGQITGIAPNEDIFSARFMGDRLYLVTFEKIDPFFVIDLSEPTMPRILGELKIPGFSDYLHPFDENHIIGFGKDTQEADSGEFSWFQGMKLALFDVTDPANPIQKHVELIGDRGTSSELLYNHKALLFDKNTGLLAFPVSVHKIDEAEADEPFAYGEEVFQGAYVYNLSAENGFNLLGTVTHYENIDFDQYGIVYNINKEISRIIRMDNVLYTLSQGLITAVDKDSINELNQIELE